MSENAPSTAPRNRFFAPVLPGDPLVAGRAITAASIGLAVQLALITACGLAALWADSQALYAATWHMAGGLPIWVMLLLLYQQHEQERVQRLSAEKLAADASASTAAIFANLTDDLDQARTRLDRLYRYGLPAVSLLVAIYLVVAGGVLLARAAAWPIVGGESANAASSLSPRCNPVGLLFVMAGLAFTAFVGGRWLAGYARQRAWQLLRGGSSYLMSCFVVAGLLFAAVLAVAFTDDTRFLGWVAAVIPSVMIAVGCEILLTSLLESYRPRVPGAMPRPAFDSRVLGLLTAPGSLGGMVADLINYQFGVEVSRSWLYRLLGSAVTPLTIFGAGVLVALSGITVVGPDERGVVLGFGGMRGEPLAPGIHWKWPWPIERVEMHPVGRVQEITVSSDLDGGSRNAGARLWTGDGDRASAIAREFFLTAPSSADEGVSLVDADVNVQYTVANLRDFLEGSAEPRRTLALIAEREAFRHFATHGIDTLLGRGRAGGGGPLHERIQAEADRVGLGVNVVGVAITSLHPPIGAVSRAFHAQIGAVQEKETRIQRARKDAVEQLARVAGSVELAQKIDAEIRRLDDLRAAGDATTIQAAGPKQPGQKQPAQMETAREESSSRDSRINEIERRIDALLAQARGRAAETLLAAKAYRWSRAVGEKAEGERFAGEILAFEASPAYYRTRRFLEVLAEGLSNRRKFVIAGDTGDTPVLRMDFSDPASAIDTLLTE